MALFLLVFFIPVCVGTVLEDGIFYKHLTVTGVTKYAGFTKSLYRGSEVYLNVEYCEMGTFTISWMMGISDCETFPQSMVTDSISLAHLFEYQKSTLDGGEFVQYHKSKPQQVNCSHLDHLQDETKHKELRNGEKNTSAPSYRVIDIPSDGRYLLIVQFAANSSIDVKVKVEMKSSSGYLSAVHWPLLPFYGVMCAVYSILAFIWLVLLGYNWRDPLKIQFWICGSILIGLLESIVMYEQYKQVNNKGITSSITIFIAQWISCLKYSSTKVLLIVISIGYGIIRSSLGKTLHLIMAAGFSHFSLCTLAGCLIAYGHDTLAEIAALPLILLDVVICMWILRNLLDTMKQLKLRKNHAKLSLYKCLTGVTIIGIISNVIFLMWSTEVHKWKTCITKWQSMWLDDAYWSISNCILQITIMILIRPTANNQRYEFSLLKDADSEDEESHQPTPNDAFESVKMRPMAEEKKNDDDKNSADDALKWVDDNLQDAFAEAFLGTSDTKQEQEAIN